MIGKNIARQFQYAAQKPIRTFWLSSHRLRPLVLVRSPAVIDGVLRVVSWGSTSNTPQFRSVEWRRPEKEEGEIKVCLASQVNGFCCSIMWIRQGLAFLRRLRRPVQFAAPRMHPLTGTTASSSNLLCFFFLLYLIWLINA